MSDLTPATPWRISASILTFNAIETLPRVLEGLERQTLQPDRILIVDNSSGDGTTDYIRALPDRFEKLLLGENLGVGAGHNAGWRKVLSDHGSDFIWTLENDSIPPDECLERLVAAARELEEGGTRFGCVAPRQVAPGFMDERGRPSELQRRPTMTFNGTLIKASAIETVGWIREDFFMDQEDREYAARMNAAELPIYKDLSTAIVHLGKSSHRPGPPTVLRTYYRVRNETFTRRHIANEPGVALRSFVRAMGGTLRALISEDHKARRIRARWRGTLDGLRGNLGKKDYTFL